MCHQAPLHVGCDPTCKEGEEGVEKGEGTERAVQGKTVLCALGSWTHGYSFCPLSP